MSTVAVNRIQQLKRRSTRMGLNAKIGLSGQDRQKCSFTMPARATNLNRYGAAIQLNRELEIGSTVVIQNSRRTQASARVVTQVSAVGGVFTYGVEFQEDDAVKEFWGITFPSQA
jgi:ribose 1,5-bisphosphokinase PhnN